MLNLLAVQAAVRGGSNVQALLCERTKTWQGWWLPVAAHASY